VAQPLALTLVTTAPANLPPAAADRLASAAAKAMKEPFLLERLGNDAAIGVGSTPAEFAGLIAQERQRWKAVVARAKIKSDS